MGMEDEEEDKETVKGAPDRAAGPGSAEKKGPKEADGKGKGKGKGK